MEDPPQQQEEAHRAKHDEAPEVPKKWLPFFEDDIDPSLPPNWKPPTFTTLEEMLSSADVSEMKHEPNSNLDQEVVMK